MVKAFYTSGLIYDALLTFGELSDEAQKNGKYAKWKAAYIHNCLKSGETPVAGPLPDEDEPLDLEGGDSDNRPPPGQLTPPPSSTQQQPFQPPPAVAAGGIGFDCNNRDIFFVYHLC